MNLLAGSYLLAAAAFAVASLHVPLRVGWHVRIGLLGGMAWALLVAVSAVLPAHMGVVTERLLPLGEVLRYGSMLLLLAGLYSSPLGSGIRRLNLWLWGGLLLLALGAIFMNPVRALNLVGLSCALLGLVNAEQLLRAASLQNGRAVKLCVVGLGGQFAYDLFLYSQAELLGGLDQQAWTLRGFVVAVLTLIASSGLRQLANASPLIFVSRQVVFYSTAFLSVGIYLVFMALGGYYVRSHGGSWGESLRMLFFVGAGVVLALLMMSATLWRRLRVFVAKHFYRNKYDYRVEWLRFIQTLSGPDSTDAPVASIRAIAQILESPGGVLYRRDEGTGDFKPAASWFVTPPAGTYFPVVAADQDLVRFLVQREWVIDIAEYRRSGGVYQNIRLPDWMLAEEGQWRIISPLFELDQLVGFLVLRAPPEPYEMTFEDRDLLRTVGRHVVTLLAQQEADRKLTEGRQFDAFNRFAAFVMHDLKNSVAQLQLLVVNAERHRHNPEFMDDAIATIGNSAARMTRLIEQLQTRDAAGEPRQVKLLPLFRAAMDRCAAREPAVQLDCVNVDAAGAARVLADADRLGSVFDHVVRNAQDASGPAGKVVATFQIDPQWAQIEISDDGQGMEPAFVRDRLFRPFDSTKGSKGMGIGAYQTREYVRQLGGHVEVQSSPGLGTRFLIKLPLCQTPNPAF